MSRFLSHPAALILAAASPLALAADPVPAEDTTGHSHIPEVVNVKAERQHYRSLSATGATKTDALLMDLPSINALKEIVADFISGIEKQSVGHAG